MDSSNYPDISENTMPEDTQTIANDAGNALLVLRDAIDAILPPAMELANSLAQSASMLLDCIIQLQLSSYSTERQTQLKSEYEKWGNYGWTLSPLCLNSDFPKCPETLEEADALMLPLYNDDALPDLFQEICRLSDVPDTFSEAIWAFNSQKFRACSLVAFSLIERTLILSQTLDSQMKENRRVGNGGIQNVQKQYENAKSKDMFIYTWLLSHNVVSCLNSMYENSANFIHEPTLVNRHFIEHGMSNRFTTRTECIKLFLVYYNLLFLTDWLKDQVSKSAEKPEV